MRVYLERQLVGKLSIFVMAVGGGGEGGEGKHSVVDETVNFTAHDE